MTTTTPPGGDPPKSPKPTFRTSDGTNAAVRTIIGAATASRGGRTVTADRVIATALTFVTTSPETWTAFLAALDKQHDTDRMIDNIIRTRGN